MRKYFIALLFSQLSLYTLAQSGVSTSLFSGRMSYSIPIYTVEDPDFHLDIALRYNTEGFKPFQPSGCYGQDWTLVAGGCITRTVQGIADEQKVTYRMGYDWQVGMLQSIKDSENPTKESVFNFTTPLYKPTCGIQYYQNDYIYYPDYPAGSYCEWDSDYMPDIYNFSFCGYKGRFIINNLGKPIIISGDFAKIDVSNFRVTENDNNSYLNTHYIPSDTSCIIIHTTDGYIYTFGGSRNAMEYSVSVTKNDKVEQPLPAISSWYLTKIKAPNGRSMTFNYSNGYPNNNTPSSLHSFITDYDWAELAEDTVHIVYSLRKECLLRSITTSDSIPLTISSFSSEDAEKMYNHTLLSTKNGRLNIKS